MGLGQRASRASHKVKVSPAEAQKLGLAKPTGYGRIEHRAAEAVLCHVKHDFHLTGGQGAHDLCLVRAGIRWRSMMDW